MNTRHNLQSAKVIEAPQPVWPTRGAKYNGPGPDREAGFDVFNRECAEAAAKRQQEQQNKDNAQSMLGGSPASGTAGFVSNNPVEIEGVVVKGQGFFGRMWGGVKKGLSSAWSWAKNKGNNIAEKTASSVVLVATSIVMPIINQGGIIANEGIHDGGPRDASSRVSWAVPYKVQGGNLFLRHK